MKTILFICALLVGIGTNANVTEETMEGQHRIALPDAGGNFTQAEFECLFVKSGLKPHINIRTITNSLYRKNGVWYCYATVSQYQKVYQFTTGPIKVGNYPRITSFTWETTGTCV